MLGSRSIEFFRSMSNAAGSGVPLTRAVTILGKGRPPMARNELDSIRERLEAGEPISSAMAALPSQFPGWQTEIVRIGEATGRLDASFKTVAELLEERRAFALDLLSGLSYPLFLIHAAPLLIYGSLIAAGNTIGFALGVGRFLLGFYVPAIGFYLMWKQGWLPFRRLPLVSAMNRAQFCFYLSSLIHAAVPVRKALELSAEAAGIRIDASETSGETVTARLGRLSIFSEEELARIEVAEESGKLDDDLARLAAQAREKWKATLKAAAAVLPPLVYLVVGIVIALRVVAFYNDYFAALNGVFR